MQGFSSPFERLPVPHENCFMNSLVKIVNLSQFSKVVWVLHPPVFCLH